MLIPPPTTRTLFTCDPSIKTGGCGKPFVWADLNPRQKETLNRNAKGVIDNKGPARLDYLRGDRSNEAASGEGFRPRNVLLGDIVNSDPIFVGKQDFGFEALPGAEGAAYQDFRRSTDYRNRPDMVYVGANDGMLHAFDALTGVERFAFVPNSVFNRLVLLTDAQDDQGHQYLVDGSPRALDAHIGGAWQTVLVGALGAGGRGVFALRITDPTNMGANDILWEFSNVDDADLGFSIPQPSIARMNNGQWVAIVANGYGSARQNAVLFILDLETGAVIKKIDTGVGGDNGLSSPIPVDVDADRITDFIYAGDLKGNLWKFDVTEKETRRWDTAFKQGGTPMPLFSACATTGSCASMHRQPITARPEIGFNPQGGFIVYFGTGSYFQAGDSSNTTPANSFYGIFDRNDKGSLQSKPADIERSQLLQQQVLETQLFSGGEYSELVRITSSHRPNHGHAGWYIDLPGSGERQVSAPILRGGRIIFTTLTPDADSCESGNTGWLMEADAYSGSRLAFSPFDINRDRQFNNQDFASIMVDGRQTRVPVSGRLLRAGMAKTPAVITAGGVEYKYAGGATGGVDVTVENGAGASGRQSWQQLK
jgi:type IV pilus assembly protein PilY1